MRGYYVLAYFTYNRTRKEPVHWILQLILYINNFPMILNIAYSGHKNLQKNIQYKVEHEYCKCLREDRSGTYQLGRGVGVFC